MTLEEDGFPVRRDSVIDTAWVTMDVQFAHEGPAVDSLELQLCFVWRLVLVRASQCANLEKQCGTEAYTDACTATESGADWKCRSQGVDASWKCLRAEGEEQVKKGGSGSPVDFSLLVAYFGGNADEVWLHYIDKIRVKTCDQIIVHLLLSRC